MKKLLKHTLSLIITVLFFLIIEFAWRIRMTYSSKNPRLLFYGIEFFELKARTIFNKSYDLIHKKKYSKKNDLEGNVIWTLGGSTTKCSPYVQEQYSWPNTMEHYLNISLNKSVTVVNKAILGSRCNNCVDVYKTSILRGEKLPVLAIFYMGINDAVAIANYQTQKQNYKEIKVPFLTVLNCRLMNTSLLYASLKEKYFQVFKKDINKAWKTRDSGRLLIPEIDHFRKDLNRIIDISNNIDSKPLICLFQFLVHI